MTNPSHDTRIVVGIDGSDGAARALDWAVHEARLRNASVVAVHAWSYPFAIGAGPNASELLLRGAEAQAEQTLSQATADLPDDVRIESVLEMGLAADCLLTKAKGADLLVLGSRGRGGFAGLLLGSVSHQCAQHSPCPVVIVPPAG